MGNTFGNADGVAEFMGLVQEHVAGDPEGCQQAGKQARRQAGRLCPHRRRDGLDDQGVPDRCVSLNEGPHISSQT